MAQKSHGNSDDPKRQAFLATLGSLVVCWNHLEASLQSMVYALGGAGSRTDIITAHMGNVALCDALRVLSAEFGDDMLKPHLVHFIELFDRVRTYRNYYVHGVRHLGLDQQGAVVGMSQSISAKTRLILHQETVTEENLKACNLQIEKGRRYADAIISNLWQIDRSLDEEQSLSSLQKPPLPDKLRKPRLPLLGAGRQPQSSEGS